MIHHHKPECLLKKKRITSFKVKVTAKAQNVSECPRLSRWYFLNGQTFCHQTWHFDASSWAVVSCKSVGLLFSSSRSQQRLMWSDYDSFYYIFGTADPSATRLGSIVHYHKPECLMKKLDIWVQAQGHSNIFNCQWMFVQMVSSWLFSRFLDSLVKRLDYAVVVKVRVTGKVQNYSECSFWRYLLNCQTFCNQTWYCDASSSARVPSKMVGLLSSRSRSHWQLI